MDVKKQNIQYIDYLRALAVLGVVTIHVASALLNMTWNKNPPYWWIGNVAESLVRFSVPMFLMLSGATMLGREYPLSEFYKRRFTRVFVPFVFWLIVYWVFRWSMLSAVKQPHDFVDIMKWAVQLFLNEGVSKHFWYVYMIMFIYLALPFAGNCVRKLSDYTMLTIIVLWIVLLFFVRNTPFNTYRWNGDYVSKIFCYVTYSGYLLVGYFLAKTDFRIYKRRWPWAVIYVLTVLVASVGTFLISGKRMDLNLHGNLTLNSILQSSALFLLFKNIEIKNNYLTRILASLSSYSYGIYLAHIMVLGLLFYYGIYWSFATPLISVPVLVVGITFFSYLIVLLIRKMPGGKYVSG
jgi:surface polysaccharide O-acyltransferase-like enzyme